MISGRNFQTLRIAEAAPITRGRGGGGTVAGLTKNVEKAMFQARNVSGSRYRVTDGATANYSQSRQALLSYFSFD